MISDSPPVVGRVEDGHVIGGRVLLWAVLLFLAFTLDIRGRLTSCCVV